MICELTKGSYISETSIDDVRVYDTDGKDMIFRDNEDKKDYKEEKGTHFFSPLRLVKFFRKP